MSSNSKWQNPVHHGYGFVKNNEPVDYLNWKPRTLNKLANKEHLPILSLRGKFRKPENGSCDPITFKVLQTKKKVDGKTTYETHTANITVGVPEAAGQRPNLKNVVQAWIQSQEAVLIKNGSSSNRIVPIICYDKSIRYARTLEQYSKIAGQGYAIEVQRLTRLISSSTTAVNEGEVKYYTWSVPGNSSPTTNEGIMFEYYVFNDLHNTSEKRGEKWFQFFSLTSFDWSLDGTIYRFFCIGEIDGVKKVKGKNDNGPNYLPVEVKSCSSSMSTFTTFKLNQYYAKCVVSHIPRLIVGFTSKLDKIDMLLNGSSSNREINYTEIREYNLSEFSAAANLEQKNNFKAAMEVFHANLINIEDLEISGFLNGTYCAGQPNEVIFEDKPKIF